MKSPFTSQLETLLSSDAQYAASSKSPDISGGSNRIIYPAEVVSVDADNGMRRIKARIIQLNPDGTKSVGKDKNLKDDELVTCIPLLPVHFSVVPRAGEMVILFLENFGEGSTNAPRYYIGPIRSTYYNFDYEDFVGANKIRNPKSTNVAIPQSVAGLIPDNNQVVVQGKKGADIVLSNNNIKINVSKLQSGTLNPDTISFGQLELNKSDDIKQYINKNRITGESIPTKLPDPEAFSQTNIRSNSINLIATEGANKSIDQHGDINIFTIQNEKSKSTKIKYDLEVTNNPFIFKLGKEAESLHPLVFGDFLILLLSKIIVRLETHIHTPQKPPLPDSAGLRADLLQYTIDESGNINRLAELISKLVRTN